MLVEHHIERFRHPEYALGVAWVGLQGALVVSGILGSSRLVFAIPLGLLLVVGSSAVFPPRGVVVGVALTGTAMLALALVEDTGLVLGAPAILAYDLALLICVGMLGAAVGRSTIEHRDLAIVDQLTGLFNRAALESRAAELAHRSAGSSAPVAVIVADVDRFKAVNDSYGHATGDAVLKGIGDRVRQHLRAFESAYRVGGEEFVILLDEVDRESTERVATRLHQAIRQAPIAGVPVTMSFGLAATGPGEPFDYQATFQRADAALYDAKRAGGDRVSPSHSVLAPMPVLEAPGPSVKEGPVRVG